MKMSAETFQSQLINLQMKALVYLTIEARMDLVSHNLELGGPNDPEGENKPWLLEKIDICKARIKFAEESLDKLREEAVR